MECVNNLACLSTRPVELLAQSIDSALKRLENFLVVTSSLRGRRDHGRVDHVAKLLKLSGELLAGVFCNLCHQLMQIFLELLNTFGEIVKELLLRVNSSRTVHVALDRSSEVLKAVLDRIQELFSVTAIGSNVLLGLFGYSPEFKLHVFQQVLEARQDLSVVASGQRHGSTTSCA